MLFTLLGTVLFGQWESILFQDGGGIYSASSELEKPASMMDFGKYSPHNLFDHNTTTSWVEGEEGSGIGSYILVGFHKGIKKYVLIYNGYQQSKSLYQKNNRVRDVKISLYAGYYSDAMAGQFGFEADTVSLKEAVSFTLKDKMGVQRFEIPFNYAKVETLRKAERSRYLKAHPDIEQIQDFIFIRFEIVSVYRGTEWDDTCISGIEFTSNAEGLYIPVNEKISDVFQDDTADDILIRTSSGQVLTLLRVKSLAEKLGYISDGEFLTAYIEVISSDKEWAIIAYQHGFSSGGRVEETHKLWSVRRMSEVSSDLLGRYNIYDPLDFIRDGGRTYLESLNGTLVLLNDIDLDMDNGF